MKAVTFSYDDGVTQDIRLVELFAKYGLTATFHLNSARPGTPGKPIRTKTGVRYCRTIVSNHGFDRRNNLYEFKPTVYQSQGAGSTV